MHGLAQNGKKMRPNQNSVYGKWTLINNKPIDYQPVKAKHIRTALNKNRERLCEL